MHGVIDNDDLAVVRRIGAPRKANHHGIKKAATTRSQQRSHIFFDTPKRSLRNP